MGTFADAQRAIREMAKRQSDLSPVLRVIANDVSTFVDDRFDTSTDPTGAPWAPLAPATIAGRRGGGEGAKPLIDTARLRQSITTRVERTTIKVGTNVEYAGPHQFGTAKIPQRRFLPFAGSSDGSITLETAGPAGQLWERAAQLVRTYIVEGRIA